MFTYNWMLSRNLVYFTLKYDIYIYDKRTCTCSSASGGGNICGDGQREYM